MLFIGPGLKLSRLNFNIVEKVQITTSKYMVGPNNPLNNKMVYLTPSFP